LLKARSTNPPVSPDFAEFADRPMAAGTAESLFYLADHIFPALQSSVIEPPAGAALEVAMKNHTLKRPTVRAKSILPRARTTITHWNRTDLQPHADALNRA
jgi:hypothetical protein